MVLLCCGHHFLGADLSILVEVVKHTFKKKNIKLKTSVSFVIVSFSKNYWGGGEERPLFL